MEANGQPFTMRESNLDDLTFLTANSCQVAIAVLSTETEGVNSIKSIFCSENVQEPSKEHLQDLLAASRESVTMLSADGKKSLLSTDPSIEDGAGTGFYACVSLKTSSEKSIVRLAVLDQQRPNLTNPQLESLKKLARQAVSLLELEETQQELMLLSELHRNTKAHLHKIIDDAEVGVWSWCLDTDEFRYTERWARMLGYTAEEMGKITKATHDGFVHPADLAESTRVLADYRSGILPRYECELRMRHKRGYWVWVLDRGELTVDSTRSPEQWMYGTTKDTSEQVVAHEQIYVRERRFEILLENSEDAILILNEKGVPHFETESVSKILGYKTKERAAESIREWVHPDDLEGFEGWFQTALENPGQPIKGNISRMRHLDGTWRHVSGTLTNLLDDPVIKGLINNFKDVTEQVLAEDLRQKTENKYRKLAQEGADMVAILSPEGEYKYISSNFLEYLGFTEEELIVKVVFELIHPDDVQRIYADFLALLGTKSVRTAPFRYQHKDGSWTWIQSIGTNWIDDPDIRGVVVNSVDVTGLLEAQRALEQSNERFKLVLKAGSESIYDYDPVSRKLMLSETFGEAFGIEEDKSKGDFGVIYERIHPADLDQAVGEFQDALDNPEISIWTREYRLQKGDGTYAHIRDRSIKVMDDLGNPVRVVGALMDISDIYFFQKLLEIEKEFIESSLVNGTHENELYRRYLVHLESLIPGMRTSLSRVVNGRLVNAISPSLPQEMIEAIEGIPIGPNEASCGSSAYLNEKVFVTDVSKDPRWENYRDLARAFGVGACWSFPIIDSEGKVVATIANYYSTPKEVGEKELQALERAHRLISLMMAQYDHLEKIRRSNERYELVNKTTNEAIFDWDVKNDKFHWGESLQRVFGHVYDGDEFDLEKWISLMHPTDSLEKADAWSRFIADPTAHKWTNQFRFLKEDGSFAFVEESSYLIRDERGNPLRMIGVLRDSTELKKMETLLASASKVARMGAWEMDVAQNRLLWSAITCEIHEVPVDFSASSAEGIDFYREDYREIVAKEVALAIEKGEKFDFEAPIITAKGQERWVRSIGEAEFVNGQCVRIFGSIQDIQERKLMEERLKGVSDSIPGVIFQYVLNPDGTDEFRYVSKGAIPLLGLTPDECMSDSRLVWSRVAQRGELDLVRDSLDHSAKTLNYWSCEWRVLTPQGKIRWREGLGKPVRKVDGSIVWDALIMDVTERKNLEHLLEQSARMAKIGSWELDLSGSPVMLNWSSTTRSILEFGDLSGTELDRAYSVFVDGSQGIVRNCMENLIQHGAAFDVELELISGNGTQKWIRCIGEALLVRGKVLSAYGSFQDIHDRKLSELNLTSLLLERNTILESIGDGFFAVDSSFTVTYWNKQAEKLLRVPREDILGKNLWNIFGSEQAGESYKNYQLALETGAVIAFEDYFEKLKSWFSISAFPSDSGLTVYFKDVTAHKKAQEEIRQSNDRFERVSEATNDAIWDFQLIENKLYWGTGFATRFGYDLDKITPSLDFYISRVHPQDRSRIEASMAEARSNPEIRNWNEEYRFQRADGSYAHVMDRAIFTRNPEGQSIRIIGALSDITDRKEFENSLQRLNTNLERQTKELAVSNAELEQFAYVASHDLQEPLRMVSSFLSQLDRKYRGQMDEKAQSYIHFAVDGATRMRQIILDLLEYSRVGKVGKVLEEVNLEEVIFEVSQLQSQLIIEKGAKIEFGGHATVTSFRSPILQLFQNLISNALKYGKEDVPPVISIACREEKDHWLISVKDNGIGIRQEYFEKIFVIFQRLHAKDAYTGTGLGLAIVKKIIETLGGRIWLESVFGEGTTFYFTIAKPGKES
ncbi:PAS domain-containing protein [Algoriphagus terrigena]|uniref:PAS domain-containing protein n=1 Tax=Algoriphagus terrigena TaxID=344884 RepID=UPI000426F096|nr:PAS domain-containing protein [Algoriphagus terrigena]